MISPGTAVAGPRWAAVALGCLLLEAWLFTWGRGAAGHYASPVLLLLSGLAAVGCAYRAQPGSGPGPLPTARLAGWQWLLLAGVVLAGVGAAVVCLARILPQYPIDIANSDVLPALSIYAHRLLVGQTVYTPFTQELGYPALPTYLPATWGPYVVAEALRFDYRWLALALLLVLGFGAYAAVLRRLRLNFGPLLALAAWPFVLLLSVMRTEPSMFGHTVEAMICGYYLLLMAGVLLAAPALRLAGLVLCLLSRYSLVFWVPLYVALLFFQRSRRQAVRLVVGVAVAVAVLYVVPFLSHNWGLFLEVQAAYVDVALGEWRHLNGEGLPYHLYNGVGVGNLFYRFGPGSLALRLHLLQITHLGLLMGTVGGAAWFYWRQAPAARINYRPYAVLALKAYLVFFYAFIQVPYAYLASVSIFASLMVALVVVGRDAFATEAVATGPASTAPAART